MADATMLTATKLAIKVTTDKYDSEIEELIDAALLDLGVAGITTLDTDDLLVRRAVITYVKLNFGKIENTWYAYDRLKESYDEQKAQLSMCTGYTDWGDDDES